MNFQSWPHFLHENFMCEKLYHYSYGNSGRTFYISFHTWEAFIQGTLSTNCLTMDIYKLTHMQNVLNSLYAITGILILFIFCAIDIYK
jgi:hypothetical protein